MKRKTNSITYKISLLVMYERTVVAHGYVGSSATECLRYNKSAIF